MLAAITKDSAVSGKERGIVSPKNLRTVGLCVITACYVLFVVFTMYRLGEATTRLYDYPYTVLRETREMMVRVNELQNSLPALLATPGLSLPEFEGILKRQENVQNVSVANIRANYLGDAADLAALEKALAEFWQARRSGRPDCRKHEL